LRTKRTPGRRRESAGGLFVSEKQELIIMSEPANILVAPALDDGWVDAAREGGARSIRGTLIKFADWRWTDSTGAVIPDGTTLIALAVTAAWIRWEDSKPVQHIFRQPGEDLPARSALGFLDQSQWEPGLSGDPKDPWADTRYALLVDPKSVAEFTFTTSTIGGRQAVADLAGAVARMRTVRPGAAPLVALSGLEMPTRYGKKSKPYFKIVDWVGGTRAAELGATGGSSLDSMLPPSAASPDITQMNRRRRAAAEGATTKLGGVSF
jgi:hypothetical protein